MRIIMNIINMVIIITTIILLFPFTNFAKTMSFDEEVLIAYKKQSINILDENDGFVTKIPVTDRYYTQGLKIGYTSKEYNYFYEDNPMKWGKWATLVFLTNKEHVTKFNISLVQEMYTSSQHSLEGAIADYNETSFYPHPMAGLLYVNFGISQRTNSIYEHISLKVGLIGEHSFAGDLQTFIHRFSNKITNGKENNLTFDWTHQIKDEPIINLQYFIAKRWRIFNIGGFEGDFSLNGEFALGNLDVHFGGGGQIRFGYKLNTDFGLTKINRGVYYASSHNDNFYTYIFGAAGGRIVAHNMIILGNTGAAHHPYYIPEKGIYLDDYKLNIFQADFQVGAVIGYNGFRFGYVFTYNTRDYKQQEHNHAYAGILLEIAF